MTKNQFMEVILSNGVNYVAVVSFPDYKGGRIHAVTFSSDFELGDFEYIEWEGDATQLLKDRNMVFEDHVEVFHEEPQDYPIALWEMVIIKLMNE